MQPAVTVHRLARCGDCSRQFDLSLDADLARLAPGATFVCSCGADVTVPSPQADDASVVACSQCGAPREGRAPHCTFCGSGFTLRDLDLDAVCPRCGARVSRRGRFCHHCSLPLTAPRDGAPTTYRCPACAPPPPRADPAAAERAAEEAPLLVSRRVAGERELHLFACPRCAGLWLDRRVFDALVEGTRQGRRGLPAPPAVAHHEVAPGSIGDRTWSYRPCAVCGGLMNRRNYARRSGVLIDVCKQHGIWFDGDELHRVLTWIEGGGATESEVEANRPRPATTLSGGIPMGGGGDVLEGAGNWWYAFDVVELVVYAVGAVVDWVTD